MKVFKGVRKSLPKAIRVLKKHFGVEGEVYYPLGWNNEQHGYKDDDISYPEDPDYTGKILIPALFRRQSETLALLDAFYEPGDFTLFEENNTIYHPKYSKIVLRYQGMIRNFRIDDITAIKDDLAENKEDVLWRKYHLVPDVTTSIQQNRDELLDALIKEVEPDNEDFDNPPEESITTTPDSSGLVDIERIT